MVKTTPTISIGLPVYNGERFISQAIECMLDQTFDDLELVICDNASTDRTAEICKEYQARDSRVRYFLNEENIGAAPNYNRTFQHSRGRFFTWNAADDLYAPEYLERLLGVLNDHPDVIVAHTRVRIVDEDGTDLQVGPGGVGFVDAKGNRVMSMGPQHLVEGERASDRFAEALHKIDWCFPVFGLVRSEFLKGTQLQRSYYGADKVLLAELSLRGRFKQIDDTLYFKRIHEDMSFYKSVKEKRDWIDPNVKHRLPQMYMVRDYLLAVAKSDLSASERARCLWHIVMMCRRDGLWRRVFVPGPDNYLGLDFSRSH